MVLYYSCIKSFCPPYGKARAGHEMSCSIECSLQPHPIPFPLHYLVVAIQNQKSRLDPSSHPSAKQIGLLPSFI
jgi:hypothetical protein